MHATPRLKIAYLCSQYPAISHTFVLGEVLALRAEGADVSTFSVRRATPEHLLSEADHAAFETTYAILPPRWATLLCAHLRLLRKAPRSYLSGFMLAMQLAPNGLRGRLWQLFYFVEAILLWSECRARGIRHIHAHFANVAADVALIAAHVGTLSERRRVWSWSFTMHGPTELSNVRHFRLAEKVRHARFVVCISDYARSQLMTLNAPTEWSKLHVVHVGVSTESFDRSRDASTTRIANKILCVGRLVPEKGHAILLQAIATVTERGQPVHLDLIGEGPSRPALESLAERLGVRSRVNFHGAVGQDAIRRFYSQASLFCLASFAEGVPVVFMEAMAMELPVISTRITGVPELVTDGVDGLLVVPARADQLAEAILSLLTNEPRARELGRAARAKVLSDFNLARSSEELMALFAAELAPSCSAPSGADSQDD
ncbi:MAG TPA: glycosyltransferase family 4 protein [Solirubrobacteraceae bacterium]|nr:glycosyltransferase family 4 protein [Solirubrobacteraceae bacterium]